MENNRPGRLGMSWRFLGSSSSKFCPSYTLLAEHVRKGWYLSGLGIFLLSGPFEVLVAHRDLANTESTEYHSVFRYAIRLWFLGATVPLATTIWIFLQWVFNCLALRGSFPMTCSATLFLLKSASRCLWGRELQPILIIRQNVLCLESYSDPRCPRSILFVCFPKFLSDWQRAFCHT